MQQWKLIKEGNMQTVYLYNKDGSYAGKAIMSLDDTVPENGTLVPVPDEFKFEIRFDGKKWTGLTEKEWVEKHKNNYPYGVPSNADRVNAEILILNAKQTIAQSTLNSNLMLQVAMLKGGIA